MPASSEFIDLCRSQITSLIQSLDISLSAVYLTTDPTGTSETALIPLVMYPDDQVHWPSAVPLSLPEAPPVADAPLVLDETAALDLSDRATAESLAIATDVPETIRQVLPLLHEDVIWGMLVVGRHHRHWNQREQAQLEQVAHTLAIACVLDQRSQWLSQRQNQYQLAQSEQQTTLSTLLHQFRNPLTTLRTLGKLILKRLDTEDANRPMVESIVNESNHLEHLLQQFDAAIDIGEAALEEPSSQPMLPPAGWLTDSLTIQPCWLADMLAPTLQAIAGRLAEKELQLKVTIPDDLPPIAADPTALREVLGNLIDNAIKYTPMAGMIWLEVGRKDQQQILALSDTGPGVPTADLERIFERDYRGIQAETDIPGTGLGLAIARDLIQAMNGSLRAISPAIHQITQGGTGTTFLATLPEHQPS